MPDSEILLLDASIPECEANADSGFHSIDEKKIKTKTKEKPIGNSNFIQIFAYNKKTVCMWGLGNFPQCF